MANSHLLSKLANWAQSSGCWPEIGCFTWTSILVTESFYCILTTDCCLGTYKWIRMSCFFIWLTYMIYIINVLQQTLELTREPASYKYTTPVLTCICSCFRLRCEALTEFIGLGVFLQYIASVQSHSALTGVATFQFFTEKREVGKRRKSRKPMSWRIPSGCWLNK